VDVELAVLVCGGRCSYINVYENSGKRRAVFAADYAFNVSNAAGDDLKGDPGN